MQGTLRYSGVPKWPHHKTSQRSTILTRGLALVWSPHLLPSWLSHRFVSQVQAKRFLSHESLYWNKKCANFEDSKCVFVSILNFIAWKEGGIRYTAILYSCSCWLLANGLVWAFAAAFAYQANEQLWFDLHWPSSHAVYNCKTVMVSFDHLFSDGEDGRNMEGM